MGAGQSKQQLAKPSSSSSSLSATSSETSPVSSIKNAKEESGGCPMKNADGTYRTMPGFASLFGAKHPPVAGNAVVVAAVPEKRIDLSTSSRPATTAEIDQRSIPAWFVSFSAGMVPFCAFLYGHSRGLTKYVVERVVHSPIGVYGLFALPFVTLSMEKCIYDTVQAAQGLDPNVIPADRGGFPSGGGNLPSFSLIAVRK